MMINNWAIKLVFILAIFILSGCITTTALYGNKFELQGNDIYTLKVMYGGNEYRTAGIDKKARKKVIEEAEQFVNQREEYSSFEILDFKRNLVPSYMRYRLKFKSE